MTANDYSHHGHAHDHSTDACCSGHTVSVAKPVSMKPAQKVAVGTAVQTPIRIMQMDCPTEEALLRKKLGGMAGVAGMEFNLMQHVLTVTHEPIAMESILAAVRSLGFTPEIADADHAEAELESAKPWWPLALAGVAAIASEATHWLGLPVAIVASLLPGQPPPHSRARALFRCIGVAALRIGAAG
jgi:Cd2+/Zn2+-exporting ATPase